MTAWTLFCLITQSGKCRSQDGGMVQYEALTCKKALHIIPGNGHLGHLDRNKGLVFKLSAEWATQNLV
jgi:hypothetical protein